MSNFKIYFKNSDLNNILLLLKEEVSWAHLLASSTTVPPGLLPHTLDQRCVLIHSSMSTQARSEVKPILPPALPSIRVLRDNTEAFQGQRGNVVPPVDSGSELDQPETLSQGTGPRTHRKWEAPQPAPDRTGHPQPAAGTNVNRLINNNNTNAGSPRRLAEHAGGRFR